MRDIAIRRDELTKTILFCCILTLVSGCAITPVHFDGKSATYSHGESDFAAAMGQAREMCKAEGKGIKHESTSCSRSLKCVSTFVCIGN